MRNGLQSGPYYTYEQNGRWCVGSEDLTLVTVHDDVLTAAGQEGLDPKLVEKYYATVVCESMNEDYRSRK